MDDKYTSCKTSYIHLDILAGHWTSNKGYTQLLTPTVTTKLSLSGSLSDGIEGLCLLSHFLVRQAGVELLQQQFNKGLASAVKTTIVQHLNI